MFKKITTKVVLAKPCKNFKRFFFNSILGRPWWKPVKRRSLLNEVLCLCKSEIRLTSLGRMKMLALLILCSSSLYAQQKDTIIPLKIGNKIPAWVMNTTFPVLRNRGSVADSMKLNQYKGKLILLDFWAAWCSTCIYKFPVLESLQLRYPEDLAVILVDTKNNRDPLEQMEGILSGKKAPFISSKLESIYNDTVLNSLFPHSFLPHYVWIGKDGTLKALSGAELLNEETLKALLGKKQ